VHLAALDSPRTIHVFVALADNVNQGIVPVPAKLGNGEDRIHNLYWGSAFGVKTYFARSADWKLISCGYPTKHEVLERCAFKYRAQDVYLIADAYRGREIQTAMLDFLDSAAGIGREELEIQDGTQPPITLAIRGGAQLVSYIGHDGLMDAPLPRIPRQKDSASRKAIILACASKVYFANALRASGAHPLLWTTNLMAPEAYTLKSALDGWILGEDDMRIRDRAAAAYDKYQKCGIRAARNLMATGW
jgi:hypothetical protein